MLLPARQWLYEHQYLIPNPRRVLDVARHVMLDTEHHLIKSIEKIVPKSARKRWLEQVLERRPEAPEQARLEWLQQYPHSRRGRSLPEAFLKVQFLLQLGVHRYTVPEMPFDTVRAYANRLARLKLVRFSRLKTSAKTLALVSFLRFALWRAADVAVEMWLMRVGELHRACYTEAECGWTAHVIRSLQPTP